MKISIAKGAPPKKNTLPNAKCNIFTVFGIKMKGYFILFHCAFKDNAEKEEQIKRALRDKRNVEAELEKVQFCLITFHDVNPHMKYNSLFYSFCTCNHHLHV